MIEQRKLELLPLEGKQSWLSTEYVLEAVKSSAMLLTIWDLCSYSSNISLSFSIGPHLPPPYWQIDFICRDVQPFVAASLPVTVGEQNLPPGL